MKTKKEIEMKAHNSDFWKKFKTLLNRTPLSSLIFNLLFLSLFFPKLLPAQEKITENKKLLKLEKETYLGTYWLSDRVIMPSKNTTTQDVAQTVLFDNTISTGIVYFPGANKEVLDWATLPEGGEVNRFEIFYGTEKTSGSIEMDIKFYTGTNSSVNGTEIFSYTLTGLPVSSGGLEGFKIAIDLTIPFNMPSGEFGYSYVIKDENTGPVCATGGTGLEDAFRLPPDPDNKWLSGDPFAQFYMWMGCEPQTITVTSPNGGENWEVATNHAITWESSGSISNVKIELSRNGGSSWSTIDSSTHNEGSYTWTVLDDPSENCLVRISDAADGVPQDISDAPFSISSQVVLNPPENLTASVSGKTVILNWNVPGSTKEVELKFDDGTFETYWGFDDGTGILANGPFVPPSYPAILELAKFLTSGSESGTQVDVNVYIDPTGQFDRPLSSLLAGSVRTTIGSGGHFQSVDLSSLSITLNSGHFFIGIESLGLNGQTNIGLGNDDDAPGEQWLDADLDGIFAPHSHPGVYAIRAVVRVSGAAMASSSFEIITLEPKFRNNNTFDSELENSEAEIHTRNYRKVIKVVPQSNNYEYEQALLISGYSMDAQANLQSYNIYRSTSTPVAITPQNCISNIEADTTTYTDPELPGGTYYYVVTGVYDEGESEPSNGVKVEVPMELPDLIVDSLSVDPVAVAPEDSVSVTFSMRNRGNGDSGNSIARIVLSGNSTITTSDTTLANVVIPALSTNTTSATQRVKVTIPSNVSAGSKFIGVIADVDNSVNESIENNNTGSISISVIGSMVKITGNVTYYSDPPINLPDITITANGTTTTTDSKGKYLLQVNSGSNVTLTPTFTPTESQILSSIGAFDAVPILQHAVGLPPITGPLEGCKFLAADVNGNGQVTSFDAVPILRLAAGFPLPDSVVPSQIGNFVFEPDSVTYENINSDTTQDFIGAMRGDVNGGFQPASSSHISVAKLGLNNNISGESEYMLIIGNIEKVQNSNVVHLPLLIQANNEVFAIELELNYDASRLQYSGIELAPMTKDFQLVVNTSEEGRLRIAMAGVSGIDEDQKILKVRFKLHESTKEPVRLSKPVDVARIVLNDISEVDVLYGDGAEFTSSSEVPETFSLSQNYPNPFNPNTTINFAIPLDKTKDGGAVRIRLEIYNILGELVITLTDDNLVPGYYSVNWNRKDDKGRLASSGIYFYRLCAGDFSETKKMLIIE